MIENTIKVDRGFYSNTLTESQASEILEQNSFLKSILLMVLNGEETWQNEHEVEFSREEAMDYLLNYNVFKGYNKSYIRESISKIIINN
jgi:hypothetical protein